MERRIGILLPRSTDYPAMAFDMLDGLRSSLTQQGVADIRTIPENIGFGEDRKFIYSKAEKLLLQDDVDCVIAYLSPLNAESLYPLFETAGKPLIVLDPGMNYPVTHKSDRVLHISLQGLHANYLSGRKAGAAGNGVIMATSFYDGGYNGPWAGTKGAQEAGGTVTGNYISHYKESEFTIQPFVQTLTEQPGRSVSACFSSYLATLFINNLTNESVVKDAEFHCSSFMAEEQTMANYNLPDARFFAYIPWASVLELEANTTFLKTIAELKNKTANIFHLLGWEAGIVAARLLSEPGKQDAALAEMLNGWSYESPRGTVTVHPETHIGYAPVYYAQMVQDAGAKARINVLEKVEIAGEEHLRILQDQPDGIASGWFNNYLCT